MVRFSVVVPVHRIQGYLRECLESTLSQGFTDLELIVVDDCSPDASAAIAAEYVRRDPRVQLVRLDARAGAGGARNAGAARACGEFLLFLDGDDVLLPGALAAVDRALRERDLDVLVFDHERVDWWESVRGSGDRFDGDPLAVTCAAWNRVFRRTFWSGHSLSFSSGVEPYEDVVPVQLASLLAGARLGLLDRACVRWRRRRGGSSASRPGREHFAVLARYEALFAEVAVRSAHSARVRCAHPFRPAERLPTTAAAAAVAHLLAVLNDPHRIRPADRAEFFRRAARLCGQGGGVFSGSYTAFRARGLVEARVRAARETLARRKKKLRAQVMKLSYRTDRHRALDPHLAVYGAYWNRGLSCNPLAVYEKARELAPHVRGVWVVSSGNRHKVPPGVPYVIEGSRRYWEVMARATYLVNNSSFPGGFVKRPGQVYLQTHHGTPLKKMGLDQRRYPAATHGISFQKVLDHTDQWDFSLSSNPHSTEVWERVYPSAYEALELGYPRNDVYFGASSEDVTRIRKELGVEDGRTVLLYAPTHRDYQKGFLPRLDLPRFVRALGPDVTVLVRAHYFYGARAGLEEHPRLLDVTAHPRVEELCLAADALVTDYSSLMFDYACLDRPIITYAPDWQAYRLARGTYFDLLSGTPGDTPGAVATSEEELSFLFQAQAWDTARTTGLRAAFRARFCPYDDGNAAERVVRRLFLAGGQARS
ncbi:bifunctional glycosyltransferase/CDP-glycerol:glycerophosphate glycerophosphotransferase [Streptomyces luteolus]|uniref:Bifunctional glycosyltransferase family 2 protein/CDP-glycerol:glycerophosphate glycerophosphotransferase n=1 Tax=Streptomyces luteolus TaxID=3043615 RepID=A0ABT6T259_9ACTN|nr:bifunctional glycosyltransferase family 2 protein/CDP-glycerol:glycerophosphate glycerophosphotransferase [Streptomyces sp. B-S-A12]MDI3421700.1 bifunctional glycosyltransferase family 2 protein/CDP-glycerol:glycerophosphate glycerophosphotransferase [Streptomyces sp. B-S-A12]